MYIYLDCSCSALICLNDIAHSNIYTSAALTAGDGTDEVYSRVPSKSVQKKGREDGICAENKTLC